MMNDIILTWGTNEYSLFNSTDFKVENIENLTWGQNELSLSTSPYFAGDTLQNQVGMARDITITLKPTADKGDYSDIVHKFARMHGKDVSLVWKDRVIPSLCYTELGTEYPDLTTDLVIYGVMNEFSCERFTDQVRIVMNIHCSDPYWESSTEQTMEQVVSDGIPTYQSVCNYSEVPVGFEFEADNVVNTTTFSIYMYIESARTHTSMFDFFLYIDRDAYTSDLGNYMYISFDKGKIQILNGTSADDAVSIAQYCTWEVQNADFPTITVTDSEEGILLSAAQNRTSYLNSTVTWTPKFL